MFITSLLILIGVILVSMIFHELMHGLVAYWLGDDTAKVSGRLTLNPLHHLDPVMSLLVPIMLALSGGPIFGGAKPVPVNFKRLRYGEWGMALVAIAGPAANFLIALVGFLVGHWTGLLYEDGLGSLIIGQLVLTNIGFMVFNLFPIPPLDGSRIIYAVAPDFVRRGMEAIEQYGIMVVMLLVVVFGAVFMDVMQGLIMGVLEFFIWIVGGG